MNASAQQPNMKDFLAQLEKSADLNYLLQSQYAYPGLAGMAAHVKPSDFATAAAAAAAASAIPANNKSSKHEKSSKRGSSSSSSSSSSQQQQRLAAAAQHQRLLEEEYKKDASKLQDFLRSPEYAMMFLEQSNAMGGALASAAVLGGMPTGGPPPQSSTSSRKSRKSSTTTSAQQAQQSSSMAELSQLLHGSSASKMHELNALFQQQMASAGMSGLSKQAQQQQMEMLAPLLQQQAQQTSMAPPSPSTSTNSRGKQNQSQSVNSAMSDYMSLLSSQSKMSDMAPLNFAPTPPLPPGFQPDLSMLFGNKNPDLATLNASIDMLGNLLNTLGQSKNTGSDITSILFPPGGKQNPNLPDISQFLAAAAQFPVPGCTPPPHSKSQQTSTATSTSSNPFYSQGSLDKAQQELLALYGVTSNASTSTSTSTSNKYSSLPDPLSKSQLGANNMFMQPSALYAKIQQEALNAMIMKPPSKVGSASPYSSTKSRETSASPARNYNRDSPSTNSSPANIPSKSPSGMKHNFSVVDLAVSSVPPSSVSPRSPSIKSTSSNNSNTPNDKHMMDERKTPSMLDVENLTAQNFTKKRMEFSSIADLASPQPKLRKIEDYIGSTFGVQDLHVRDTSPINLGKHANDDDAGVINLSTDTSA